MSKIKIGIASENRPGEKRVVLCPQELGELAKLHQVFVEKGAGEGVGIRDAEYKKIGATVADKSEVYSCNIVVRLKEPKEEELALMKPGSIVFSMLHLPGNLKLQAFLKKYKITAIPMEELKGPFGNRKIEALHDAGRLGMEKGFDLWNGEPGNCVVKIMGYGNVAGGAIKAAARKFAKVIILNKKDVYEMEKHIPGTDILVNGINWPMEKRGKVLLVKKEMLKLFKPGSVIVDLTSNPAGQSPIESMHPTTLDNIYYEVDGVIHTSCWSWPGSDPVGISRRYSVQVAPILLEIANQGIKNVPQYIKNVIVPPK